ncbi:MAG: CotH kinase family protein [Prevotella sp.]|nr:CotH kinase family protein [Prevotella sp.]
MMHILRLVIVATFFFCLPASGQWRAHVYMNQLGGHWNFPVVTDSVLDMTVSGDHSQLLVNVSGGATVPFAIEYIDSVAFEQEPAVETKNPYQVFQLYVTTNDGQDITSRHDYKPCHISLGAGTSFTSFSANAQIRGRGNSSFHWYDKKPYRLKLDQKHKVLGLPKAKSWVLLANYRDVTDLMNTFVFEMGRALGLPYTNHTRYVELFVNGDYRGLYQLTEQVQQNKNRVAVSSSRGILLSLDVDDGPDENPGATDNFYSAVYHMPACVKFPDDEYFTPNTTDSVRAVFATLEQAIRRQDYNAVKQLLDVPSFIKYLLIQEFVYNVELSAPRSIFLHKDGDGPWVMGPLWDFDGGYDFDWGNMYSGHTYFTDYRETVMGTNPLWRNGEYGYVPQFFTDLFGCPEFVRQYKSQWAEVKDTIVNHCWQECIKYVRYMRYSGALKREAARWPIAGKDFEKELAKMLTWLRNRAAFMTELIANIPEEN